MAKNEESVKPHIPTSNSEDEIYEDPPSYEEATQSTAKATQSTAKATQSTEAATQPSPAYSLFQNIFKQPKRYNRPVLAVRKPELPLQYYPSDPKHVKCRCGKHVDTTKRSPHLAAGTVKCSCGYIVSSTGYACHPSQASSVVPPSARKCSCGEFFAEQMYDESNFFCHCGAVFDSTGHASRLCPRHQGVTGDARNVRCRCGRYLDTTAVWRAVHGTNSTRGESGKHPRSGWSHYDYTLPEGTALCECGFFVKRDGSSEVGDHWKCCRVQSCKPRESILGGSEESCTCMQP